MRELRDYDATTALFASALRVQRDQGDTWAIAFMLEDVAVLATLLGEAALALRLAGAAAALRNETNALHGNRRAGGARPPTRRPLGTRSATGQMRHERGVGDGARGRDRRRARGTSPVLTSGLAYPCELVIACIGCGLRGRTNRTGRGCGTWGGFGRGARGCSWWYSRSGSPAPSRRPSPHCCRGSLGVDEREREPDHDGTQDWAIWGYASGGTSTSLVPDVRKSGGSAISDLTDRSPSPSTPLRGLGFATTQTPSHSTGLTDPLQRARAARRRSCSTHGQQPSTTTLGDGFRSLSRRIRRRGPFVSGSRRTRRRERRRPRSRMEARQLSRTRVSRPSNGANVGGLYTIDYAAASGGQTLTVEWVETASSDSVVFGRTTLPSTRLHAPRAGRRRRRRCPGGADIHRQHERRRQSGRRRLQRRAGRLARCARRSRPRTRQRGRTASPSTSRRHRGRSLRRLRCRRSQIPSTSTERSVRSPHRSTGRRR